MLVPCPECGREISSAAPSCPSCGVPLAPGAGTAPVVAAPGAPGALAGCLRAVALVVLLGTAALVGLVVLVLRSAPSGAPGPFPSSVPTGVPGPTVSPEPPPSASPAGATGAVPEPSRDADADGTSEWDLLPARGKRDPGATECAFVRLEDLRIGGGFRHLDVEQIDVFLEVDGERLLLARRPLYLPASKLERFVFRRDAPRDQVSDESLTPFVEVPARPELRFTLTVEETHDRPRIQHVTATREPVVAPAFPAAPRELRVDLETIRLVEYSWAGLNPFSSKKYAELVEIPGAEAHLETLRAPLTPRTDAATKEVARVYGAVLAAPPPPSPAEAAALLDALRRARLDGRALRGTSTDAALREALVELGEAPARAFAAEHRAAGCAFSVPEALAELARRLDAVAPVTTPGTPLARCRELARRPVPAEPGLADLETLAAECTEVRSRLAAAGVDAKLAADEDADEDPASAASRTRAWLASLAALDDGVGALREAWRLLPRTRAALPALQAAIRGGGGR